MRKVDLHRRAREIAARPYAKLIHGDPVEGFLGEVPELPGCLTAGASEEEALANLSEAMTVWLMTALEDGATIPEPPSDEGAYLLVWLPERLRERLMVRARAEDVTLPQLALNLLWGTLSAPTG